MAQHMSSVRILRRSLMAVLAGYAGLGLIATGNGQAKAAEPDRTMAGANQVTQLSLSEAVAQAHERSFRVARAIRHEQIADLRTAGVSASRLPKLSVGVGLNQAARGTYQASPTYTREQGLTGDFRTGVNIAAQMPVDLSGALRRQIDQAKLGARIADLDVEHSKVESAFEVAMAYVAAMRARAAAIADEEVVSAIARIAARADRGTAPFIEVELSAARQAQENSRAAAEISEDGLRQLLRLAPEARLVLTTTLEQIAAQRDTSDAPLRTRPDIKQAKLRIDQARLAVKQAADSRRPSMNVNAYFNQSWTGRSALNPGEGRNRDQGGVIALNVPLYTFDWGATSSARRSARLYEDQARADLEEKAERAAYELRQAQLALDRAEARLRALASEGPALAALRQAETSFLHADGDQRRSLLAQVSNARAAWREARLSALSAKSDRALAALRVKRALGLAAEHDQPEIAGADRGPSSGSD